MNRRQFLTGIGTATAAALTGCINRTKAYGFDDPVSVRDGTITLIESRATKTLFTQPADTPRNLIGRENAQYVVFTFDTSDLAVEPTRKHSYLRDSLQYQLSPDTVAQDVAAEPSRTKGEPDTTSVAFQVTAPFTPNDTRLLWTGQTAQWRASDILAEHTAFLTNPPRFTVSDLTVNRMTAENRATLSATVQNNGGSTGTFKAIVRADDTAYIDKPIRPDAASTVTATVALNDPDLPILISWGVDEETTPFADN